MSGEMQEHSEENQSWKHRLEEFRQSNSYRELPGIEWNIFPGLVPLEIFQHFSGRIIFMSMFNDIDWTTKGNSEICLSNSEQVKNDAKKVPAWTLVIPHPRRRRNMVRNAHLQTWRKMELPRWRNGGTPVRLNRGKRKVENVLFTSSSNTELLFHTIHPANQLSIHGAVASWCGTFGPADSWSKRVDHGKVCRRTNSYSKKAGAARSDFFGTNAEEGWWCSGKPLPRMSWKVWQPGESGSIHESFRSCSIHKKSLHWDDLQNCQPAENTQGLTTIPIPGSMQWSKDEITISPVLQVHVTRCLDVSGIEIQILSTTWNGSKSWVVMSRGNNRHVEDLLTSQCTFIGALFHKSPRPEQHSRMAASRCEPKSGPDCCEKQKKCFAASRTVAHTAARSNKHVFSPFWITMLQCSGDGMFGHMWTCCLLLKVRQLGQVFMQSCHILILSVVEKWSETRVGETPQFTIVLENLIRKDSFHTRRKLWEGGFFGWTIPIWGNSRPIGRNAWDWKLDGSKTAARVSQGRRMRLLWVRLASACLQRKQQDQVSNTAKTLKRSCCLFALFKDTLVGTWSRLNKWVMSLFQMERIPVSLRLTFDVTPILRPGLIAGGRKSKEGRQTVFFTPLKPFRGQSRWRRT